MTAFEEMRTRCSAMVTDAKLADEIAADLERAESDVAPWVALRFLAHTMRTSAAKMVMELQ